MHQSDHNLKIAKQIHAKLTAPGFSGATVEINGDDVWISHPYYPTVRITWAEYMGVFDA